MQTPRNTPGVVEAARDTPEGVGGCAARSDDAAAAAQAARPNDRAALGAPRLLVIRLGASGSVEDAPEKGSTLDIGGVDGGEAGLVSWISIAASSTADDVSAVIRRVNEVFAVARKGKYDVLVVTDGGSPTEADLRLIRVAASTDPMVAFVVPPRQESMGPPGSTVASARLQFAPPVAALRTYIRHSVVEDFGDLDPQAGDLVTALTELMARANRRGYRTVIGTALAVAPAATPENLACYPEVEQAEARFERSPERVADRLLLGLRPTLDGRLRVAFDCTVLTSHHAGTSEATRRIVQHAAVDWTDCDLHVICAEDVFRFHGFDVIPNVRRARPDSFDLPFAAVIRVGQLFAHRALAELRRRAPVQILTMLDTIALDCAYLDAADLQRLWQDGADAADALVFISTFSRDQFERRFRVPAGTIAETVPFSLNPVDYRGASEAEGNVDSGPFLVVGNHFEHKAVGEVAILLADATSPESVVLLGHPSIEKRGIRGFVSGQLAEAFVDRLYQDARCVVFPSHYEGFGFPVMHALARRKPVVARNLPPFQDIAIATGMGINLHLADTTPDLIARATDPTLRWSGGPPPDLSHLGWKRCAAGYRSVLQAALANLDHGRLAARVAVGQRADREYEAEILAQQLVQSREREAALTATLADSREREAALTTNLTRANEDFAVAEAQYIAAEAHFNDVEAEFIEAEAQFLADEVAAAQAVATLAAQKDALAAELGGLAASRDALLSSTSWRATAPLRKAISAAKALRDPALFFRLLRQNVGADKVRRWRGQAPDPRSAVAPDGVIVHEQSSGADNGRVEAPTSAYAARVRSGRLFVDVTFIAAHDHGTGIQRVVRSIVRETFAMAPSLPVEPVAVRLDGHRLVTAHRYTERVTGQPMPAVDDNVDFGQDDILVMLDSSWFDHERFGSIMAQARRSGSKVYSVVYDLIPLLHPEMAYEGIHQPFARWFAVAVSGSDGIACISRAVADQVRSFIDNEGLSHDPDLRIGSFHLGADHSQDENTAPSRDVVRAELERALGAGTPLFLMVGTLEPRKGHAIALDALGRLWTEGRNVALCILGKEGWQVEDLVLRLRSHREAGHRLHWIADASDAEIAQAYQSASALVFPSIAEGFGLPIVEAAHAGLPVLCSDLAVLREVAGDHALYFASGDPTALAAAMRRWLDGCRPDPAGIHTITWSESACQLLAFVLGAP